MKSLYLLLLLTGSAPLVLPISTRKYYLIQKGKKWTDAQAYCQATHTDLAIIDSNDNMVRLQSEAQKQQLSSSAWIGLYNDINSWRWSYENEPLGSMTKWMSGEPNNNAGNQTCVAISVIGWMDRKCTDKYPVVCFDDSKTDSGKYIKISEVMTWSEAQSYCRQYYTDLASITDETEYSIVKSLIINATWIGLFRDPWKWVDKTNFSTISWMPTQPNNKLWHENCGYLNNSQAGDALCSDIMPFFCYRNITRRKLTIRVKIQSNQDMKDPAVTDSILEKITQKMKDHRMADNTTMKWRVHPDGLVFQKKMKRNNTAENVRLVKCDL